MEEAIIDKDVIEFTMLKLINVLSKLILPTFKSSDDTVLQKLYDHICCSTKEGLLRQEKLRDVLVPWLLHSVNQWNSISDEVKGFILRIVSQMVKDSKGFSVLHEKKMLLSIHSLVKENIETPNNCIILSYIEMVNNLINHDEGKQWVIDMAIWKDIIPLSVKSHSIYVKRRSQNLLSSFLVTLNHNTSLVQSILIDVLNFGGKQNQLINAHYVENPCIMNKVRITHLTENKDIKVNIYDLLSEILLTFLNSGMTSYNITELFGIYQIQDVAWTEIHNAVDTDIILAASKLLCVWNISTASPSESNENKLSEANFSNIVSKHLNLLIIRHLFPKIILETCVVYSSLWHKNSRKFHREESNADITKVENLIFLLQGLPMFVCMKHNRLEKSEITELFVDKLFKVACPSLIRLCYFYRDQLRVSEQSLEKISCQVINSFIRVSSFCEKEQAVMIFQGFMHLLKDFVHPDGSQNSTVCPDNLIRLFPDLLAALVSGLACYLKKFKISWRDSLETVCMLSFIQHLITNPDVPFLVCAEALKLAKLVLLHFMPPNLALLVDTLQGSSMTDLGNQLFKTLGSVHWEVRDSSLEVLQVIGSLAVDKFSAFQALLLENDLPVIILSIVEADCESYVRASALSCLSELVKVQIIWDSYLQKEQVLNTFLTILYFETEGIVRNKATLLMKDICKFRTISENIMDRIYDTLYYVAQNDLHWEVRISALEFWDAIIEQCFISVGLVDGSFPDVIFSTEKKKIIKMTPIEMKTRVINAVTKLSSNGCLQILWETLQDECDIQVQRKSANVSKKLIDIINCYGVFNDLKAIKFCMETDQEDAEYKEFWKNQRNLSPEAITDEIVAANDNDLSGLNEPKKCSSNDAVIDKTVVANEIGLSGLTEPTRCSSNDAVIQKTVAANDISLSHLTEPTKCSSHDAVIDEIVAANDIGLLSGLVQFTEPTKCWPKINRIFMEPLDFANRIQGLNLNDYINEQSQFTNYLRSMESLLDDILLYSKEINEEETLKNSIDCY